eukprot:9589536-Heterocapsa_arctica.AAC.1
MEEYLLELKQIKSLLKKEAPGSDISEVSMARRMLRRSGLISLHKCRFSFIVHPQAGEAGGEAPRGFSRMWCEARFAMGQKVNSKMPNVHSIDMPFS